MAILVANISSGKGTWQHVSRVIDDVAWERIFLITDEFGKTNFKPNKKCEYIVIDGNKHTPDLTEDIHKKLKSKILDT